jgi:16S rRNA (guanine527-N7)-methyltransferase
LVPVSHETLERLDRFADLLRRWQSAVNLIAASTVPNLWTRHIADSLQILDHAPGARRWMDLGSGAGFPGLVIAIALADRPGAMVDLVERDSRKAAFLREAARTADAPVKVHAKRVEDVVQHIDNQIEIVTARALAPMPELILLCEPLLAKGAKGIFLKGQYVDKELTDATKSWQIDFDVVPSRTDPRGRIVIVRGAIRRRPPSTKERR